MQAINIARLITYSKLCSIIRCFTLRFYLTQVVVGRREFDVDSCVLQFRLEFGHCTFFITVNVFLNYETSAFKRYSDVVDFDGSCGSWTVQDGSSLEVANYFHL